MTPPITVVSSNILVTSLVLIQLLKHVNNPALFKLLVLAKLLFLMDLTKLTVISQVTKVATS